MRRILTAIGAILLIAAFCGFFVGKTMLFPMDYKEEIETYAEAYGADPYLVAAVINMESNFADLDYKEGEKSGVMQIREEAATRWAQSMGLEDFDAEDLSDPDKSIKLGCWYLGQLTEEDDAVDKVLEGWANRHAEDGHTYEEDGKERYIKRMKAFIKWYKLFHGGSFK